MTKHHTCDRQRHEQCYLVRLIRWLFLGLGSGTTSIISFLSSLHETQTPDIFICFGYSFFSLHSGQVLKIIISFLRSILIHRGSGIHYSEMRMYLRAFGGVIPGKVLRNLDKLLEGHGRSSHHTAI